MDKKIRQTEQSINWFNVHHIEPSIVCHRLKLIKRLKLVQMVMIKVTDPTIGLKQENGKLTVNYNVILINQLQAAFSDGKSVTKLSQLKVL